MTFDRDKFKKLIVYIAAQTKRTPGFGATKLNKVLWFADSRMYVLRGQAMTGATYIREKYGPVPKMMMPIRSELVDEGAIRVRKEPHYNQSIDRIESLVRPDASVFDGEERKTIDYWIKVIATDHTAESISEETHDYVWEIARLGEEIPYYAIFANRIRASVGEELEWARKEAADLGLA